jgi:hypothetical protein
LQNLRTFAGKGGDEFNPYKAYLRIGCLEMEKARRQAEKDSAMQRISSIDERFREIDAEMGGLLRSLAEHGRRGQQPRSPAATAGPARGRREGNFTIKY